MRFWANSGKSHSSEFLFRIPVIIFGFLNVIFLSLLYINCFADTAAILISVVSNSHYGMLWGQIHIHLSPEHPIISFETIEIKMATLSAKWSMKFYLAQIFKMNEFDHRTFILLLSSNKKGLNGDLNPDLCNASAVPRQLAW